MNCFDNGRPNLTASERTRDLGCKVVVTGTSSALKGKRVVKNYDGRIEIYRSTGRLRNIRSYRGLLTVARGIALCRDGRGQGRIRAQRGLEACSQATPCPAMSDEEKGSCPLNCSTGASVHVKPTMAWNSFNVLDASNPHDCRKALVVAESILLPTKACCCCDCCSEEPDNTQAHNIVENRVYPSDEDASGVVLDPNDILFGSGEVCRDFRKLRRYLSLASVLRNIKVTGYLSYQGEQLKCSKEARALLTNFHGFLGIGTHLKLGDKIFSAESLAIIRSICCHADLYTINATVLKGSFSWTGRCRGEGRDQLIWISKGSDVKGLIKAHAVAVYGGDGWEKNLSWGNNTSQNYLASFSYPSLLSGLL